MSKVIITVVGKDTVGIIAKVCACLAENHINILDNGLGNIQNINFVFRKISTYFSNNAYRILSYYRDYCFIHFKSIPF